MCEKVAGGPKKATVRSASIFSFSSILIALLTHPPRKLKMTGFKFEIPTSKRLHRSKVKQKSFQKLIPSRLIKNAQMQGARSPEE
jgi:hypothetical protein